MLKLFIKGGDFYIESKNEFVTISPQPLHLEHSLISISKWESKWNRSFLHDGPKTEEEKIDYIRDMTINQHVDPTIYKILTEKQRRQIDAYCNSPMTATTINRRPQKPGKKQIVTSELIYYWMTAFNIPFECEKWHLNRLMTLIEICSIKSNPTKESKREAVARHRAVNARRRAKH